MTQSEYRLQCYGASDTGKRRSQNEDRFVCDPANGLFLVADGMGGEKFGEVASQLAADTFVRLVTPFLTDEDATLPFEHTTNGHYLLDALQYAVQGAHQAVVDFAGEHPSHRGMGSTLTAVVYQMENLYTAHVGDSRLYRLRNGQFQQLTEDHSKVQEMVNQKLITPEEAWQHPQKNIITQCIGRKKRLKPDCFVSPVEGSDLFLICSDGLTDMIQDEDIQSILSGSEDLSEAGQTLIDRANQSGGKDNISVVLFQFYPLDINS